MEECSKYVLCPGLPISKEYPPPAKQLKQHSSSFKDQRHEQCLLWHVPKNRKSKESSPTFNMCSSCKYLYFYLEERANFNVPVEIKSKHRQASSKYPFSSLSPDSQALRRKNIVKLNYSLKQKITKLSKSLSLNVPDDQNDELTKIIAEIQGKHIDQVNEILAEADSNGKGDILRSKTFKNIWNFMVTNKRIVSCLIIIHNFMFQLRIRNHWSMTTIRLGMWASSRKTLMQQIVTRLHSSGSGQLKISKHAVQSDRQHLKIGVPFCTTGCKDG